MASRAFERIATSINPRMVVVTARAGKDVDGCLVGFSTQCSIDPARYLVCLSKVNRTYEIAGRASVLVVNMLRHDAVGLWLARLFGEHSGRDTDKLGQCVWEPGPDDTPVLAGCDWFGGPIRNRVDLGDHVGYSIDVSAGSANNVRSAYLGSSSVRGLDAGNPA